VFSARYAGEQRSSEDNMDKLLQALSNQSNETLQFKTVVTLNLNGAILPLLYVRLTKVGNQFC
jgi:XTP/dITP diphosphohydrolase